MRSVTKVVVFYPILIDVSDFMESKRLWPKFNSNKFDDCVYNEINLIIAGVKIIFNNNGYDSNGVLS